MVNVFFLFVFSQGIIPSIESHYIWGGIASLCFLILSCIICLACFRRVKIKKHEKVQFEMALNSSFLVETDPELGDYWSAQWILLIYIVDWQFLYKKNGIATVRLKKCVSCSGLQLRLKTLRVSRYWLEFSAIHSNSPPPPHPCFFFMIKHFQWIKKKFNSVRFPLYIFRGS